MGIQAEKASGQGRLPPLLRRLIVDATQRGQLLARLRDQLLGTGNDVVHAEAELFKRERSRG